MSDPIGRPPGVRGPDDQGVDTERPDASFHDDQVGGRLKSDEAARVRQAAGRYIKPKFVETESRQIQKAQRFRPAHKESDADALERDARRQALARNPASGPRRMPRGPRSTPQPRLREQERIEQRLTQLMESMSHLHQLLVEGDDAARADEAQAPDEAVLWHDDAMGEDEGESSGHNPSSADDDGSAPDEPPTASSADDALMQRLAHLEQAAKFQLQLLVGGGGGLTLMTDPLLTFKRLFDRMGTWPPMVRPGYRPASEADVDAFLTWVFEPSDAWENLVSDELGALGK